MASAYLEILVFAIFSIAFPSSIIGLSRLLGPRLPQNTVSKLNFESSEESTGSRLSIMKEYFHYFSSFLAFEIIAVVVIVWAPVSSSLPREAGFAVIALALLSMVFEALIIRISVRKE